MPKSTIAAKRLFEPLGRELSSIILGCWKLPEMPHREALSLLDCWATAGGNAIDTAAQYGDGQSEEIIGRWLKSSNYGSLITVITKGGHSGHDRPKPLSSAVLRSDIHGSLKRLRLDRIDIYLLHRDDLSVPVGEVVETLNQFVDEGLCRTFGASNWTIDRLGEAARYAADHDLRPFCCSSPHFSLASQVELQWPAVVSAADADSIVWYEAAQLPLFAWSSQASGFFTARWDQGEIPPELRRVYESQRNFERRRRVVQLAQELGDTPNSVALAWVMQQRFPVWAIIGPRTTVELEESFTAFAISLDSAQRCWLQNGSKIA